MTEKPLGPISRSPSLPSAQYGGKMIWFSQDVQAGDGDWAPMAIVLFEFESGKQTRKLYNSPEYQAVIGQRLSSTDSNTVFMNVE